jgi:hypothetical protein
MPYGIMSAPNDFQENIFTILAGVRNIFIYLDDILLWGKTKKNARMCWKVFCSNLKNIRSGSTATSVNYYELLWTI